MYDFKLNHVMAKKNFLDEQTRQRKESLLTKWDIYREEKEKKR